MLVTLMEFGSIWETRRRTIRSTHDVEQTAFFNTTGLNMNGKRGYRLEGWWEIAIQFGQCIQPASSQTIAQQSVGVPRSRNLSARVGADAVLAEAPETGGAGLLFVSVSDIAARTN